MLSQKTSKTQGEAAGSAAFERALWVEPAASMFFDKHTTLNTPIHATPAQ
jgi:hypothetical protein